MPKDFARGRRYYLYYCRLVFRDCPYDLVRLIVEFAFGFDALSWLRACRIIPMRECPYDFSRYIQTNPWPFSKSYNHAGTFENGQAILSSYRYGEWDDPGVFLVYYYTGEFYAVIDLDKRTAAFAFAGKSHSYYAYRLFGVDPDHPRIPPWYEIAACMRMSPVGFRRAAREPGTTMIHLVKGRIEWLG